MVDHASLRARLFEEMPTSDTSTDRLGIGVLASGGLDSCILLSPAGKAGRCGRSSAIGLGMAGGRVAAFAAIFERVGGPRLRELASIRSATAAIFTAGTGA